eukprot:3316443-Amphidinium_carterae.1
MVLLDTRGRTGLEVSGGAAMITCSSCHRSHIFAEGLCETSSCILAAGAIRLAQFSSWDSK